MESRDLRQSEGPPPARLGEGERVALLEVAEEVAKEHELVSLVAYGSTIAGYSNRESDYDLIVVLRGYKARVRYRYLTRDLDTSSLVVDAGALIGDAERATLGEFVAGRLLNVYEPILGREFIEDVETRYKKRIALELLDEIVLTLGEFSGELIIPVEYLLFEKLKKRASIYPPALYSYTRTYSGPGRAENLRATLVGFERALSDPDLKGLVEVRDGSIRVGKTFRKVREPSKLGSAWAQAARGIRSYAVHGFAGRVGPGVVGRELISKVKRARVMGEVPEEIKSPRRLWRIEEGLLISEGEDWMERVASSLGFGADARVKDRQLGELYSASKAYVLEEGDRRALFVVKRFRDVRSVKWPFLNIWALPSKRFSMSPISRLAREYSFFRLFRGWGLNTPEVLAVALGEGAIVTQFIPGANLGEIVKEVLSNDASHLAAIGQYGEVVGRVHDLGYSLGDTKPSNAIMKDGSIFITDLEQASEDGNRGWDLAEFIYYSSKLTLNTEAARLITRAFLEGYLSVGGRATISKALSIKYLPPFQPLLAPSVVKAVRDEMKKMSG